MGIYEVIKITGRSYSNHALLQPESDFFNGWTSKGFIPFTLNKKRR